MRSNKLVKLLPFLILTNTMTYGMSEDRESTRSGIFGRLHVPDLPPITAEPHLDYETTQVLNKIGREYVQTPESLELETKRRKIESQANDLTESELKDLRALDERTAQEDAEEWFSEFLPHIEDTLVRGEPNLVNMIAERFFERDITLDELNGADSVRSPYTV